MPDRDEKAAVVEMRDMMFAGAIAQRFAQMGGNASQRHTVARAAMEAFRIVRSSDGDPLASLFDWLDLEDAVKE